MELLGYGMILLALTAQPNQAARELQARAQDDKSAAAPSRASAAGFGAMMVVTEDHEAFLRTWKAPTGPARLGTSRMTREKPVNVELLFSGCRFGFDARCKVTGRVSVTRPDGATSPPIPVVLWTRPPSGEGFQLSPTSLRIGLDPGDASGTYRIKAEVTDEVAGTTVVVERLLQAEAP